MFSKSNSQLKLREDEVKWQRGLRMSEMQVHVYKTQIQSSWISFQTRIIRSTYDGDKILSDQKSLEQYFKE